MVETMIDDGEEGGGKVKFKVGKTEKQQGAGGKMNVEALKKGEKVGWRKIYLVYVFMIWGDGRAGKIYFGSGSNRYARLRRRNNFTKIMDDFNYYYFMN